MSDFGSKTRESTYETQLQILFRISTTRKIWPYFPKRTPPGTSHRRREMGSKQVYHTVAKIIIIVRKSLNSIGRMPKKSKTKQDIFNLKILSRITSVFQLDNLSRDWNLSLIHI